MKFSSSRSAFALLLFPCLCHADESQTHGDLFAIVSSTTPAAIELHYSRLDVLGYASRPTFKKFFSDSTTFRGDVAEELATQTAIKDFLVRVGKPSGNWVPLNSHAATKSGAVRAQGLDNVFVKLRPDGLPQDFYIGETKWNKSTLAKGRGPDKDIDQMSRVWRVDNLKPFAEEYFAFAKAETIRFADKIPSGRAVRDLYLSSERCVHFWRGKDGLWYCDGKEGDVRAIRIRANAFGRGLQGVADGTVRARYGLFHLSPDGNDIVFTHRTTRSTGKQTMLDDVNFKTRIPRAWVERGTVSLEVIERHLGKEHSNWSERKVRTEAKKLQESLSAQELIDTKQKLNTKSIREGVGSSLRGGAFAFALSAGFSSVGQYRQYGTNLADWDWKGIGVDSAKMAGLTTTAVGIGQGTAYRLAGRQFLGRTITMTAAKRAGGVITATIFSAYAFRGYREGESSLMDASVEAGTTAVSFGVSALILMAAKGTCLAGAPAVAAALVASAGVAKAGEWGYSQYKDYQLFFADSKEWISLIDQYRANSDFMLRAVEKHQSRQGE